MAEHAHTSANLSQAQTKQSLDIEKLRTIFDAVHWDVQLSALKRQEKAIEKHKLQTEVWTCKFSGRDFVLVGRAEEAKHKLQFLWYCPC